MASDAFMRLIKIREKAYTLQKMQPKSPVEEAIAEILLDMAEAAVSEATTKTPH